MAKDIEIIIDVESFSPDEFVGLTLASVADDQVYRDPIYLPVLYGILYSVGLLILTGNLVVLTLMWMHG